MESDLERILQLEVPVVVRLGERTMDVAEVIELVPGSIIQLPKNADDELDLLVNNKPVGTGVAMKVGENFGIRVTFIGQVSDRVGALGGVSEEDGGGDDEAALLAAQLLSNEI